MVRWYNPIELLRTGIDVFLAEELNERTERLVSLDASEPPAFTEGPKEADENGFWLDFLADTGDGYEPTFAIARALSRELLEIGEERLPRGSLLVLGGDAVYPVPSRETYEERLLCPFEEASMDQEPERPPSVYALPGNHDAYDGLVSFSRLFLCRKESPAERVGIWRTRQTRTYFAIRLPSRWWLWGADVRRGGSADAAQRAFFASMLGRIEPGDRVIFVTTRPDWFLGDGADRGSGVLAQLGLEATALAERGASAPVHVTGDIHNYQRFRADREPEHRVISGGGGAFLHPTHRVRPPGLGTGSSSARRVAAYPSPARSFALSFRTLVLPMWNPGLSLLAGIAYVVFAWPLFRAEDLSSFVREGGSSLLLGAVLVLACSFYAYPEKGYRYWGGLPHGVLQTASAYVACRFVLDGLDRPPPLSPGFFAAVLGVALAGAIVLPALLGLYLFLSLSLFGFHPNEAFSALRLSSYKHFLRLRIGADGTLRAYAVGLDSPGGEPRIVDRFDVTGRDA